MNKETQEMEKLSRLVEISLTLNSTLKLKPLLESILDIAGELLVCEGASVMLYNEDDEQLYFAAATGVETDDVDEIAVPLKGSIAGTIFVRKRPVIANNVSHDPRHLKSVEEQTDYRVRNLLGVPMSIYGCSIGVLEAINKKQGGFTEKDAQILSLVASQAAVAINNARIVDELQEANRQLRQADEFKADFFAVASHELRTPLGIILGYATFLKDESDGEISEHADAVLDAALQLRSLVEDMTNMNMLYKGATKLFMDPAPIQEVINNAYNEITSMAEARNIQIFLALPSQDILVNADARLHKVFLNLLNNAIRFTPPSGKIIVRLSEEADNICVEIKDNGIGIPPDSLERIFDQFYQVEDHLTRKHNGMGLGLSIARGLVELHGGQIWAESEGVGKGAAFKVVLPIYSPLPAID
ncbi:MAG: ATP-binding protein [Chloroflexota bacterium]|nr:ATP-binding protein [Chloroflexota bacterium]